AVLRAYRSAEKLFQTYGVKWLRKWMQADGRIYADLRQIGTETGRMACRDPNLQNIPHATAYRRCFRAPAGNVLVKADYSQIELRIACKIGQERRMLRAYQPGADLHTLTAQKMVGRKDITPEERKVAKA